MVDPADILRRHWPAYQQRWGSKLLASHRRAVAAILQCRTPALGGELYRCAPCERARYVYHSCNHRACPKCGHHEATAWITKQQAHLLPVLYFLVTFTLPSELRRLFKSHQKICYNLLFRASSQALKQVAANPEHLGGQLGMLGILQTWTRDLRYHPHVHYLIPGGALSPDQLRWIPPQYPDYLLPGPVLSPRFRTLFKEFLQQHHPQLFQTLPARVWQKQWVVDLRPVGNGQAAIEYLSAYLYKTALTAQRLLSFDDQAVRFRYRQARTAQWITVELSPQRFLHRFLQHVLPRGFARVRYFGWWSAAACKSWQRILALLDYSPPQPPPLPIPQPPLCPLCGQAMLWIETLPRPPPPGS